MRVPDLVFDLRYLKYAMAVATHGSFRRAANALGLSQSTVSRRVQLLERRLGVSLFERSRTGTHLTYAGECFIRDSAFGAERLHQAAIDLGAIQRGDRGELRVGVTSSITTGFLADLLRCFKAHFPSIIVTLEEASSQSNAASVLDARLDVAFILGTPHLPAHQLQQLWNEEVYFVVPVTHKFAGRTKIAWDEVTEETFLVHAGGAGLESEDHLIRRVSVLGCRPKILRQKVSREYLLSMVAQGYGITITTSSAQGLNGEAVRFVRAGDGGETIALSAVWLKQNPNPALRNLLNVCNSLALQRSGAQDSEESRGMLLAGPLGGSRRKR